MSERTLRNERGSALVELALVLPLLCLVLIGAAELGRMFYYAIEVSDAARAGVAYGSQGLIFANAADIETAATAAAPDIANLTFPTPPDGTVAPCSCETITTGTTGTTVSTTQIPLCAPSIAATCTSTTPGTTSIIINYVELSTQAQISTMFHYPGFPTSYTLHGFAKMRLVQD